MRNKELVLIAAAAEGDLDLIKKCEWCNVWKPRENFDGLMLGIQTCQNCYYNFRKLTQARERIVLLAEYCRKRLELIDANAKRA